MAGIIFLPEAAIEAFDVGILIQLAGLDEVHLDPLSIRPSVEG